MRQPRASGAIPVLVPEWPAPAGVRALCTTRAGGVSLAPYDSLNLGDHVGDAEAAVRGNRDRLAAVLGGARPVFLKQVHGSAAIDIGATVAGADTVAIADGCLTAQRRLACTVMVADCLPVLFCDADGAVVAAAHAGWRGLAGEGGHGILESTLMPFWALAHIRRAQIAIKTIAWLGPCIGPASFEVGPEVKAAFEAHDPRSCDLFQPRASGKWLADLPGLARRRLNALGVTRIHGNDGSAAWCTVNNPSQFFSHRRDRVSGRFAACVWLD